MGVSGRLGPHSPGRRARTRGVECDFASEGEGQASALDATARPLSARRRAPGSRRFRLVSAPAQTTSVPPAGLPAARHGLLRLNLRGRGRRGSERLRAGSPPRSTTPRRSSSTTTAFPSRTATSWPTSSATSSPSWTPPSAARSPLPAAHPRQAPRRRLRRVRRRAHRQGRLQRGVPRPPQAHGRFLRRQDHLHRRRHPRASPRTHPRLCSGEAGRRRRRVRTTPSSRFETSSSNPTAQFSSRNIATVALSFAPSSERWTASVPSVASPALAPSAKSAAGSRSRLGGVGADPGGADPYPTTPEEENAEWRRRRRL